MLGSTDVSTLFLRDYQLFMKRLRRRFSGKQVVRVAEHVFPLTKTKRFSRVFLSHVVGDFTEVNWSIRYYHCGEYGSKFGRPHYHALLFNFDFPDKVFLKKAPSGEYLYSSKILSDLWPLGHANIGSVTFQSAAYVARYIMKKVNGNEASDFYSAYQDIETGELLSRSPEYPTMSRDPGIGSIWFDKFNSDVFPNDYVVVNGRKCRPPKYYDDRLKAVSPELFEEIVEQRELNAKKNIDNYSELRLAAREAIQLQQLKRLPRKLDFS
jgi:hypothetical protein